MASGVGTPIAVLSSPGERSPNQAIANDREALAYQASLWVPRVALG
jgi:hypothetical protein